MRQHPDAVAIRNGKTLSPAQTSFNKKIILSVYQKHPLSFYNDQRRMLEKGKFLAQKLVKKYFNYGNTDKKVEI